MIGFQVKIRRRGYPSQSQTFDRKTDAERWARKIEREMDDGVFVDRKTAHQTTLADLIDRYLNEVTRQSHKGEAQRAITFGTDEAVSACATCGGNGQESGFCRVARRASHRGVIQHSDT